VRCVFAWAATAYRYTHPLRSGSVQHNNSCVPTNVEKPIRRKDSPRTTHRPPARERCARPTAILIGTSDNPVASVLWDSVRTASHRRSRKYAEVVWRMGFIDDDQLARRTRELSIPLAAFRARASATANERCCDQRRASRVYAVCERRDRTGDHPGHAGGSPGMSLNTASGFADTAISVYCPDGYIDYP
jgi:hypothetical protein